MRNPAVTAPSHMPRTKRAARSPPKLVHAACAQRATDQMKTFTLDKNVLMWIDHRQKSKFGKKEWGSPDPLADGEPLEGEVLRVFESAVTEIENSCQPVELVRVYVCRFSEDKSAPVSRVYTILQNRRTLSPGSQHWIW